ncbi:STAS domain-containing protein [Amycolatopsis acidicola]|uniref:Anti-sigma factor antagonist n=1 Tax=Amycolatopsis acidicola TaxID=2596893 RepID=A0A5N0V1T8_9PSEU|nr:STAS domain-containing protein [Amycolatopsis acidicola]KAA9158763.1 STAS domain-containing protein [Amycolatopsis acidicola]
MTDGTADSQAESTAGAVVLESSGGAAVLRVSGALDLALAPKLQQLVDRASRDHPRVLVIDLTDVDFLASAGMAVLVRTHRRHGATVAVRVVADNRLTLRPLELTRLTDELAVFPTLAAALAGR